MSCYYRVEGLALGASCSQIPKRTGCLSDRPSLERTYAASSYSPRDYSALEPLRVGITGLWFGSHRRVGVCGLTRSVRVSARTAPASSAARRARLGPRVIAHPSVRAAGKKTRRAAPPTRPRWTSGRVTSTRWIPPWTGPGAGPMGRRPSTPTAAPWCPTTPREAKIMLRSGSPTRSAMTGRAAETLDGGVGSGLRHVDEATLCEPRRPTPHSHGPVSRCCASFR
jgi:hypothetical protein